ncbi:BOI-related E3 ubiquitin-protein ligase 1-like isoform X2 [Phoenix dactylifera]|uniref:BOI-related E3 ubiquitin-protein ligase 1-like isoform X2 n=1 Tax=Phoenix dactylifera TaxID=42345 RepID=A0A8B7D423_PHODC|nr:BOI-related E3 ubiquitin-protein ligase 1-like isoform X2 [Phoenix dactylifera]
MFRSNNSNMMLPSVLEANQFHYDSSAPTQLQLFGNIPATCSVTPVNNIGNNYISALNCSNKMRRETEDIGRWHKPQISLNDFSQDKADHSPGIPNPNAVSTGLRLSYDDDEHNSSITSASGSLQSFPVVMSLGDNLRTEIDLQKEEFDHYIRIQEGQIMKGVKEMKQRHMVAFLNAIEKGVGRKLREKELEIGNMNRKNKELIERIKQVAVEAQSWQCRARHNESVVNMLKNRLKEAMVQGADDVREGCGDNEGDDVVSSYNPGGVIGGILQASVPGSRRMISEQMACKSCKIKEVSVLLMPCRHLCLCDDCERFIEVCPVCQTMRSFSVPVYMA